MRALAWAASGTGSNLNAWVAPGYSASSAVLPVTGLGARPVKLRPLDRCNDVALRFGADTNPSYVTALVVALRAC